MDLLDLTEEINLRPRLVSNTNGGEYKSPCPGCKEGKDRFCIWPKEGINGKYWCRVCGRHGDAIQFCRDFLGFSYLDACKKLKLEPKFKKNSKGHFPFKRSCFTPKSPPPLSPVWATSALIFMESCQKLLMQDNMALDLLLARGLSKKTIEAFKLGWNPETLFEDRSKWGLLFQINAKGKERKQWLPKGIVIPSLENNLPVKLKVRRSDWHSEDHFPKYVEVSGSLRSQSIYGDLSKPVVVVESELDAILIQQFASDLCCSVALGGVSKRPDMQTHEFLKKAPAILLSLDYDERGKQEYPFWLKLYPNLCAWPASSGKSPGDSYCLFGVNLYQWVQDGLRFII